MAGRPLKSGFSTSASRDAANAARSLLQKRHLIADALIVSPQTGQILLSSLIGADSCAIARCSPSGFPGGRGDDVDQFVRLLLMNRLADEDIRDADHATVVEAIPAVRGRGDGAVEAQSAVDAFGAAEGNEVGNEVCLRPGADRPRGHGNVPAKLERVV